jgi:hypothetical protein
MTTRGGALMRALVAKERKPKRRAEREAPSIAIILLRSTEKQLFFQSQTRADLPPPPPLTWPPPPRRHDREQLPPKELKERENIPMVCKKTARAPLKLGGLWQSQRVVFPVTCFSGGGCWNFRNWNGVGFRFRAAVALEKLNTKIGLMSTHASNSAE